MSLGEAALRSWPLDPWVILALVLTGTVYARGWLSLRGRGARHFKRRQLAMFLGGLAALALALQSPLESFSGLLLQVHMVQHLLLMMVAPALLWFGDPLLPMWFGLPRAARGFVAPIVFDPALRRAWQCLTDPRVAWLVFVGTTWLWHIPRIFETALVDDRWHKLEHACFLATALLFWWPVVQPYPSRARHPRWIMVPYLLLADLQNTILAALLTFSDRVIYPHYADVPRLGGVSPLADQSIAGALMWVPGSLAYLIPLVVIGLRELYPTTEVQRSSRAFRRREPVSVKPDLHGRKQHQPRPDAPRWNLLDVPLVGRFLRWRQARVALQLPLLLLAAAIVLDGLYGPQVAPLNLAGVLPWIHWRGFLVIGLLVAGNFFCTACPFTLTRSLGRRLLAPTRHWPALLRSKWLAAGLLLAFLVSYEVFALWSSPWWTAWIVLGYFVAAAVVDGLFRDAAFCKYVCPIGQFNFVQSLTSPLEVRVQDADVCHRCDTKDCVRGNATMHGCELELYVPRKASNLDCTFCLDCVHACPHQNVGILAVVPTASLIRGGHDALARWPRGFVALIVLFAFAAFVNAAAMTAPVVEYIDRLAEQVPSLSRGAVSTCLMFVGFVAVPCLAIGLAAAISRWWSGDSGRMRDVAASYAAPLVPLGASMWLAHYCFHLLSSPAAAFPPIERAAADIGLGWLRLPEAAFNCCAPVADWLLRLEIVALDVGLVASLYTAYRIAVDRCGQLSLALRALAPWAAILVALFVLGIWIVFQPMEMRGTVSMVP